MTISTMLNKSVKKAFQFLLIFFIWTAVWWIASLIVDTRFPDLLPSPLDTFIALCDLMKQGYFYKVLIFTSLRVVIALLLGIAVGSLVAFPCHKITLLRRLISPLVAVIKAMPIATFILLLWVTIRGSALTIFIGFIMVTPIIYQNMLAGLDSIDKELIEVTKIFGFKRGKALRMLILPSLKSYLSPAIITSVGLAFKAQVAAEIIAYTNKSIGQYIYDANFVGNSDTTFAWAVVIVALSIGLEWLCRGLLGRTKK